MSYTCNNSPRGCSGDQFGGCAFHQTGKYTPEPTDEDHELASLRAQLEAVTKERDRHKHCCESQRTKVQQAHGAFHEWAMTKPSCDIGTYHSSEEENDPAAQLRIIVRWYEAKLTATSVRAERAECMAAEVRSEWKKAMENAEHIAQARYDAASARAAALERALRDIEYSEEPGRFCDHAAGPCHRCDQARALLTPTPDAEGKEPQP